MELAASLWRMARRRSDWRLSCVSYIASSASLYLMKSKHWPELYMTGLGQKLILLFEMQACQDNLTPPASSHLAPAAAYQHRQPMPDYNLPLQSSKGQICKWTASLGHSRAVLSWLTMGGTHLALSLPREGLPESVSRWLLLLQGSKSTTKSRGTS